MTFSLPFSATRLMFIYFFAVVFCVVEVEKNHQNLDLMALARDILHVTGF